MEIPSQLLAKIQQVSKRDASPAVSALINEIMLRHGDSVRGILFYGSCLRSGDDLEGLVDLYVLVDEYRSVYRRTIPAVLNKLLPPNVFYLELPFNGHVVRSKYAVLSLTDLLKGSSMSWFHSYLWGRFCQPTALLYTRDDRVTARVHKALAQAVITFMRRVLPRIQSEFSARELWCKGLEFSYRAELRAERPDKVVHLYEAAGDYYEEITPMALDAVPYFSDIINHEGCVYYRTRISKRIRLASRLTWGVRCLLGKMLSVLRLLKGMTTFEGGVDYILWKIQRHSGIAVDVDARLRRHPLLAMWVLSWRLYRQGGFR